MLTFSGNKGDDAFHPADFVQQLLEKVRQHRVNLDGNVCAVMITTSVYEVTSYLHFYTKAHHARARTSINHGI